MDESRFANMVPKEIVLHGILVKKAKTAKDSHSISLFPGFTVDVAAANVAEIEEARDDATGREYVRVKLKEDAELTAVFKPRIARLASESGSGVPFCFGGGLGNPFGGNQTYVPPTVPMGSYEQFGGMFQQGPGTTAPGPGPQGPQGPASPWSPMLQQFAQGAAQAANQTAIRKRTWTTNILTGATACQKAYGTDYNDDWQPDSQWDYTGQVDYQTDNTY